jgi:hypothetical protein
MLCQSQSKAMVIGSWGGDFVALERWPTLIRNGVNEPLYLKERKECLGVGECICVCLRVYLCMPLYFFA